MLNLEVVGGASGPDDSRERYPETGEVVEAGQVYDLDIIRPRFEDYKAEAARIAGDAKALVVKDDESLNMAVMIGGTAKKIIKSIDAQRRAIIEEPSDFVKGVNAICKAITDNLDEAERTAKAKISQHQARIEMERRKQEEAARKAAEELQKKLNAEAKKTGIEAPVVVTPIIPEAQRAVRTEAAAAHQRTSWTFELIDAAKVPVEYKVVSDQLIRNAIKIGARDIPGVRIFEETTTVFRT